MVSVPGVWLPLVFTGLSVCPFLLSLSLSLPPSLSLPLPASPSPSRHLLTSPKRAQVIRKLAHILQHQPSDPVSPSCSSLNFLPQSLAASIRRNGSLGELCYRLRTLFRTTCQSVTGGRFPSTLHISHWSHLLGGRRRRLAPSFSCSN